MFSHISGLPSTDRAFHFVTEGRIGIEATVVMSVDRLLCKAVDEIILNLGFVPALSCRNFRTCIWSRRLLRRYVLSMIS